jgi:hypothetical protein
MCPPRLKMPHTNAPRGTGRVPVAVSVADGGGEDVFTAAIDIWVTRKASKAKG